MGPGILLTAFGVFLVPLTAHSIFHIVMRRRPIVRLCREGIEINKIGAAFLDGDRLVAGGLVPGELVPGAIRVVWPVFSGQGLKREILRAPWEHFRYVQALGLPETKELAIGAMFFRRGRESPDPAGAILDRITFKPADFNALLDQVAVAIEKHSRNMSLRDALPSWNE